jgi:hypothetical protein
MAPRLTVRRRNAPMPAMVSPLEMNVINTGQYAENLAPRNNVIYEVSNVIQSPTGEATLVNFRHANTVKNTNRNSRNFSEAFKVRKMIQRSNGSRKLTRKRKSSSRRRRA